MSAPMQTPKSLRDYFAGQALAGLLADPEMTLQPDQAEVRVLAYADALVAAAARQCGSAPECTICDGEGTIVAAGTEVECHACFGGLATPEKGGVA